MRTVGEEVRSDLWARRVKAEAIFIDRSKIPTIEPYHYGPWISTDTSEWLRSNQAIRSYPVDFQVCPISCVGN